jgi:hypothetical protein
MSTASRLYTEAMQGVNDVNSVSYFKPRKHLFKKALEKHHKKHQTKLKVRAARKKTKPGYLPTDEIENQLQVQDTAVENTDNNKPIENVVNSVYNQPVDDTQEEIYNNDDAEIPEDQIENPVDETESFTGSVNNKKTIIIIIIVIIVIFFVFKTKK